MCDLNVSVLHVCVISTKVPKNGANNALPYYYYKVLCNCIDHENVNLIKEVPFHTSLVSRAYHQPTPSKTAVNS